MDRIMRLLRGFGRFWYDFVVGDDPKIAAGVAAVLVAGGLAVGLVDVESPWLPVILAVLLLVAFTTAVLVDVSRARRGVS